MSIHKKCKYCSNSIPFKSIKNMCNCIKHIQKGMIELNHIRDGCLEFKPKKFYALMSFVD